MDTNINKLTFKEILNLLPHRYPFLLVDNIIEIVKYKYIKTIKNVSFNEPFFNGHFPGDPIFPGVLLIESMAQTAGILAITSMPKLERRDLYHLVGIDKARFKNPVFPGDQIIIEVYCKKYKKKIILFKSISKVNKKIICKANIMCMKK
ncbi:3-hydroxyacyl-ACP dehydratase FabZ [Buchnera aphidicola (Neophyllaphis podocarpi)]|uniref:3-hydroxyacyl-ACP dehydratase FabZ n=1 Tax=Buchnera aphidicola TaxID=9 RepID=UPI0031B8025B